MWRQFVTQERNSLFYWMYCLMGCTSIYYLIMVIRSRHSYYKSTGLCVYYKRKSCTLKPLKSTHLPILPSEPINKCFRSYPVLSFFSPPLYPKSMIGPPSWGSTTSTPSTVECKLPYLKNIYSLNLKSVIALYYTPI